MSYLRFEKAVMTNLEESLRRELLRTNRSGAYSSSTLVDCNTRKYHGLLVVPVPEIDDENHVLLSSLDCTVVQHGAEFNLGLHKYQGNNFSPKGHKYIREFDASLVPTTTYRVGGVILKRETIFQAYEDRILIRYTLVDAHSATTLRFRPFLAFRSVRQFTHENSVASREYHEVENGIKTCMYAGYPDLYMQFNKKCQFVFQPDWYRGIEYPKEQERGYASNEDLYVPGYFEIPIKKDESIVFSASTKPIKTRTLKSLFQEEIGVRVPRDNFYHCLVTAAHQFHNREADDTRYLLAGYPWFKCRARDTFISLPGLTLAIDEPDYFELVMSTAERGLREFMDDKPLSVKIYEMEQPDVPLWAVWAIQQYAKYQGRDKCMEKYGQLLIDIVKYIEAGGHPNLRLDDNGLLYSNGRDRAVTWMNSTANGRPVVPRSGYIVEFNALWYNALRFAAEMEMNFGKTRDLAVLYLDIAAKIETNFYNMFWCEERGHLADYIDGQGQNNFTRPNQIFACALPYSPIPEEVQDMVFRAVRQDLLTSRGIRTLSPKNPLFKGIYDGNQHERDLAYHNGSTRPWLLKPYAEAGFKLYGSAFVREAREIIKGFEEDMTIHGIGAVAELYDGNPPHHPHGAINSATATGAILAIEYLIDKYKVEE